MKPETLTLWREALGGRRFLLTVGAGIVDTLLLWFGKLSEDNYVMLTMGTVGVYIGANTYQKFQENKNAKPVGNP